MTPWGWLQFTSVHLQSVATLLSAVLTVFTLWVLIVTWRAIERQAVASELQADAARALMRVAEEQTKAAQDAAASTRRQADLLAGQIEMDTAPLLVAEPDNSNPVTSHRSYRLFNRGHGVAFQVHYWEGHINARSSTRAIRYTQPATLAPGSSAQITIPERNEMWTAQYMGIDDQARWVMVFLDENRGQRHTIRLGGKEKTLDS